MRAGAGLVGALLVCAVLQAALHLAGQPFWLQLAGSLATTALAVVAAGRHFYQAGRSTGPARLAWSFTGAATGMWAAGSAFYVLDIVHGVTAAPPRIGDWFSLGAVLLAPGVLMAGPSAPVSWGARARLFLDGMMVATALFIPAWPLLLRPTQQAIGSTGGLIAVGIPALHIISLSIAVVLLSRSRAGAANAVTALAGGFAAFAIVVLSYIGIAANGGSWQVESMAGGFAAATVLLLFAGRFPMPVNERPWLEAPVGLRATLPYVPVLGAFVAAAILQLRGGLDAVTVTALLLMGSLILMRQYLALRTNSLLLAEVREQRRQLAHQATHDDLTGLANRKLLHARVVEAAASGDPVALMMLDLDGFKKINDQLGHGAGDDVLVRVAAALRQVVPPGHLVSRLGGDEFAILLHPAPSISVATEIADRAIAAITHGEGPQVGASVGLVYEENGHATLGSLLSDADAALYRAKAAGKGVTMLHQHVMITGRPVA
ncbi:diguanylate cyclase domain-containing protein [Micromonosporaceae bacterium Da 78-11]